MVQPMPHTLPRFNSMKVRLKLGFRLCLSDIILFQFHEGPIKTFCD